MKTNIAPQAPLYAAASAVLAKHCTDDETVYLFRCNLDGQNSYLYRAAALCKSRVCICDGDGNITEYSLASISEVRYVQYIGCAAIECRVDGELTELCRTDMKNALSVQTAARQLKAMSEGKVLTRRETDESCCPKCGTPYRAGSKKCSICSNRKSALLRLIPFAKPHLKELAVAVVLFVLGSAFNLVAPVLNKTLVNNYIAADTPAESGFIGVIAAMALCALSVVVLNVLRGVLLAKTGSKILTAIRHVLYERVQALSVSGVSRRTTGEIYSRITSDTTELKDFIINTLPQILQMIMLFIPLIIIMLVTDRVLTLMVLLPIPFAAMVFYASRRRTRRLYQHQWRAQSAANTMLHDIFSGIRVIKVFGTESKEEAAFEGAAKRVADISKRAEITWNVITPFTNFLLGLGEYVVLLYMGFRVLNGEAQLGELSMFLSYVSMLYGPVRYAVFLPRRITRFFVSLSKVFDLIDEESEITDGAEPFEVGEGADIAFENATFGYNNYEDVLRGVSLEVKHGEMVGLVGRSGVGKSTLINLVMRLYDVTDGRITINGKDIRTYDQHSLRSSIGVVLQENFMFKGTIYSNISYAKSDSSREEVIEASRMANAHSFIMRRPDGYNTVVGERGMTLSGGERQRVAIARAVLRDPQILILDEATSALDTETEKQIQDAINALISGRTTIAIAHRLSTLRNATRLVVLEKGGVEETGTHEQLMLRRGRYYKLVMAQRKMSKMKK